MGRHVPLLGANCQHIGQVGGFYNIIDIFLSFQEFLHKVRGLLTVTGAHLLKFLPILPPFLDQFYILVLQAAKENGLGVIPLVQVVLLHTQKSSYGSDSPGRGFWPKCGIFFFKK